MPLRGDTANQGFSHSPVSDRTRGIRSVTIAAASSPGVVSTYRPPRHASAPAVSFASSNFRPYTPSDSGAGNFDAGFAAAPLKLDATYTTPDQTHAMMEPFASIAAWKGDELTVWTANQMIAWARGDIAKTLQMDPAKMADELRHA